jgi:NDP-sugar pyrophosphorylase family protein
MPKALVEIHHVPMIEYVIQWLNQGGVQEIFCALHWQANHIVTYLQHRRENGASVHSSHEPHPLGWVGAVRPILPALGSDPFVLIDTDRILIEPLHSMLKTYTQCHCPDLFIMVSTHPQSIVDQGGITLGINHDQVVRIGNQGREEPKLLKAAFCGAAIVTATLWNRYDPGPQVTSTSFKDTFALPWLRDHGKISAHVTCQPFFDGGTTERITKCEKYIEQQPESWPGCLVRTYLKPQYVRSFHTG